MSRSTPTLREVSDPCRDRAFLRLPWQVNAPFPRWVPPLLAAVRHTLNRRKNPFWRRAEARFWTAWLDGAPVGRIGAILNPAHDEKWDERAGFFGFFECIDDHAAAAVLFDAASGWLRERGATVLRGPVSPSTNDECGVLIEGFDRDPFIMMPYTPPYYPSLLEARGLRGRIDLLAFSIPSQTRLPPRVERVAAAIEKRHGVRVRPIDMRNFRAELERLRLVYNRAWEDNWGFVPMSAEEFAYASADLKPVAWPEFIQIAERDGETVGATVCIPNLNPLFKKMNGRIFPFGFRHLLGTRRKVDGVRLLTLGVIPEYKGRGMDALLYRVLFETTREAGLTGECELGWVLEGNEVMLNTMRQAGGHPSKRVRLYEMPL